MISFDRNRRPREPVLIVEDREANQALIQGILQAFKIDSRVAENGQVALDLLAKEPFSLYIVDLMMPVMDGRSFIGKLKEKEPDSVVVVQTALDSPETIIDIMKLGVYDYVIKPLDPDSFIKVILRALEFKYLKNIEKAIADAETQKLKNQIEWLNYRSSRNPAPTTATQTGLSTIENIKTSLSQGSGLGAMTSIIDMLQSSQESREGGKTLVDSEILDILFENNEISKNVLQGLTKVTEILSETLDLQSLTCSDFIECIPDSCKKIIPFLAQKKVQINFPSLKSNCKITVDRNKMEMVLEELVLNAFKYCPPGSDVDIFSHINSGYLIITVKNQIKNDSYGGVAEAYEKLVTQPFYRIHPPVELVSGIEQFGLGLGLTVVESIIHNHNGLFFIHNTPDPGNSETGVCVLAEIFIPLA